MYLDRPRSSTGLGRTGSRTGFGQRESIGNPLNLSLGRIRPMSASTSRTSFQPGMSAKTDRSVEEPQMYAKDEPQVQSGYFVPVREAGAALRFYAYFDEPVLEYNSRSVPYHKNRVHKCIITFYPKDATVGVDEPKVRNSGYMQGKLLKRSHVKRPDGKKFTPGDFAIGEEVTIYGRTFTLVDADTTTRKVYLQLMKERGMMILEHLQTRKIPGSSC